MSNGKAIEISAVSDRSFEDAVRTGLARANRTFPDIRGAWVKGQQVDIADGHTSYRVNIHVAFGRRD